MSTQMNASSNGAECLTGVSLAEGWKVVRRIPRGPNATGGNFSIGYEVENADGRRGFLKALNLASAFTMMDPIGAIKGITEAFQFEQELLADCRASRMTHVVTALHDGIAPVPGAQYPQVPYLIFEMADGDIRTALSLSAANDVPLRFRALHNVAVGLRQLHSRRVAHQDLKPSNVLRFPQSEDAHNKIGDLGRACDPARPVWYNNSAIAGDRTYAPPELLYGQVAADYETRRFGCDIYQLGSLAVFFFTGSPMNAWLKSELYPTVCWDQWQGGYRAALPAVQAAFVKVVEDQVRPSIADDELSAGLVRVVEYLCEPDPSRRGHPTSRRRCSNPFDLERVIADFDLLTRRAEIRLSKAS